MVSKMDALECDLDVTEEPSPSTAKLLKALREFHGYILANRRSVPNYGDRYRHGEAISTSFVESTVNCLVSKRFVKKQQMRWSQRGAHLLLQLRARVLNGELRQCFEKWYPGMKLEEDGETVHLAV
jgi:hypothetical protein